ncbi:MAG: M23 family metallopeptidase [Clostridia bacterium]|nr:M23 family metallopeptidase [Clostridia bacterium]
MNFIKKYKAEILVSVGALLAGVLSFFITLSVYPVNPSNDFGNNVTFSDDEVRVAKNEIKVPVVGENKENAKNHDDALEEDIASGQTVIEEADMELTSGEILVVVNELAMEEREIESTPNQIEEIQQAEIQEVVVAKEEEPANDMIEAISKNAEITIGLPISGDIILEFAKDKLVYSETLEEWITHDGIDIAGNVADPVKAVLAGTVESIKMDPRYGNTIIIRHNDHLKTVYANVSTLDLVYAGKEVEEGEIISGVGAGFGFESKEGPHVHFEVIESGQVREP